MGRDTSIQWCDSTVNPTMGCDGCELWGGKVKICYAGILHDRYAGKNSGFAPSFDRLTSFPGRMKTAARWGDLTGTDRPEKPWLNGLPRHIFVSDMSDALSADIPFKYLKSEIIDIAGSVDGQRHIWMWLTKQSKRLKQFAFWLADRGAAWPENLWMGTSITSQATMTRAIDLDSILSVPHKFLSIEPLFSEVSLPAEWRSVRMMEMVICGGASGAGAKEFYTNWAEKLARECDELGISFFLKQLGANVRSKSAAGSDIAVKLKDGHGGDWSEWPGHLRIREFPNIKTKKPAEV